MFFSLSPRGTSSSLKVENCLKVLISILPLFTRGARTTRHRNINVNRCYLVFIMSSAPMSSESNSALIVERWREVSPD